MYTHQAGADGTNAPHPSKKKTSHYFWVPPRRCMGIYKFGNSTYPRRIRHRSNLCHIFQGKNCVLWAGKYGILNNIHEIQGVVCIM